MRRAARGCVLEFDADAAVRGISDGLFGLVADVTIVLQAATGRGPEGAGELYTGKTRLTRERTVRSTRCKLKGSIARMRMRKGAGSREVEGGRVEKGRREERCSPIDAAIGGKTLWGGGAPELGDLRLVEDGGELEGIVVPLLTS